MAVLCGRAGMAQSRKSVRPHHTSTRMPAVSLEGEEKSGTCPVCGGKVMEKLEIKEGSRSHSMTSEGLHCTRCGIKYEFMPPNGIKRT